MEIVYYIASFLLGIIITGIGFSVFHTKEYLRGFDEGFGACEKSVYGRAKQHPQYNSKRIKKDLIE